MSASVSPDEELEALRAEVRRLRESHAKAARRASRNSRRSRERTCCGRRHGTGGGRYRTPTAHRNEPGLRDRGSSNVVPSLSSERLLPPTGSSIEKVLQEQGRLADLAATQPKQTRLPQKWPRLRLPRASGLSRLAPHAFLELHIRLTSLLIRKGHCPSCHSPEIHAGKRVNRTSGWCSRGSAHIPPLASLLRLARLSVASQDAWMTRSAHPCFRQPIQLRLFGRSICMVARGRQ